MRWSLVSSGWTQHHWHQDSNWFATIVTVRSGLKWWYIGTPRRDSPVSKQNGGIDRLLKGFDLEGSNADRLDVDVVVLKPRDWLFLTPEPDDYMALVRDHLPNPLKFEGVIDLFCLCNLMELFGILCLWQYSYECTPAERQSRRRAMKNRKRARQLKDWFFANHCIKYNGISVDPEQAIDDLDYSFLAQQAKALRNYKCQARNDPNAPNLWGNTFAIMDDKVDEAITRCLLASPAFGPYRRSTGETFDWTGPSFTIEKSPKPRKLDTTINGATYDDIHYFNKFHGSQSSTQTVRLKRRRSTSFDENLQTRTPSSAPGGKR
ncbi:hypothetical protein DXG01_010461, partial [Tephrocybe rancida]